jgi:sensor histidine kinase YesM
VKSLIRYIKYHRGFILFLFLFSWILTFKNKLNSTFFSSWEEFEFQLDAPFWIFLNGVLIFITIEFIKRKSSSNTERRASVMLRYVKYLLLGYVIYMVYVNGFALGVAFLFGTFAQNFGSSWHVILGLVNHSIDFLIFGGFSLAYLYFMENRFFRQRMSAYDMSLAKSKIQQLRSQLNPHFLFNNLNILDQLIDEDKEKASDFLAQFAEVYRYALSSSEKELVPLRDELAFAQSYFELMETRYKDCYLLRIAPELKSADTVVPPFCMQVLLENAVMHNLGTKENQVHIEIAKKGGIVVKNNRINSVSKKKGNGVALKNLSEQFELLTQSPIEIIEEADSFAVKLPIIKTTSHA